MRKQADGAVSEAAHVGRRRLTCRSSARPILAIRLVDIQIGAKIAAPNFNPLAEVTRIMISLEGESEPDVGGWTIESNVESRRSQQLSALKRFLSFYYYLLFCFPSCRSGLFWLECMHR